MIRVPALFLVCAASMALAGCDENGRSAHGRGYDSRTVVIDDYGSGRSDRRAGERRRQDERGRDYAQGGGRDRDGRRGQGEDWRDGRRGQGEEGRDGRGDDSRRDGRDRDSEDDYRPY
jgi:hypothetical protein